MAILPTTYSGPLARVDTLRQMYRHGEALAQLDAMEVDGHALDQRSDVRASDAASDGSADVVGQHRLETGLIRRVRHLLPSQRDKTDRVAPGEEYWRTASPIGIGLRIRILRGLHDLRGADAILQLCPVERDDVILRENRIAVLDRLGNVAAVETIRGSVSQRALEEYDRHGRHRLGVALARFDATHGEMGRAQLTLHAMCAVHDDEPDAIAYGWWLHFLLRQGNVDRAQKEALRLAGHANWSHRVTAAHALARLDMPDRARTMLRQVTQEQPGYPGGWRRLLSTLRNVGAYDEAGQIFDEIVDIDIDLPASDPSSGLVSLGLVTHPHLQLERAMLLNARFNGDDMGIAREAESVARAVTVAAPHCLDAWWVSALAMRSTSTPAQIRELAFAGPQVARSNILVEYGHALADYCRWDASIVAYREALADQIHNRAAHLGLVSVLARRTPPPTSTSDPTMPDDQALNDAVKDFRERLGDDAVMMNLAGERLAQNGHYKLAMATFEQTLSDGKQHDLATTGVVRTHGWSRQFATAPVAQASQIEAPIVVLARGMLCADRGDIIAANETFRSLHRRVSDDSRPGQREMLAFVALWLSTSLRWLYKHEEAQALVEDALAVPEGADRYFHHAADLHDEMGWNWFDRHSYAKAIECFTDALEVNPRHVGALRGMIQCHRALGSVEEALIWANRGFTLHPQDANLRCEVAWLHGEMNEFTRARSLLAEALDREVSHPAALEWRIVYLCKQGWYPEADVAATEARRLRPESPTLCEAICSVPLQRGDWRAALDMVDTLTAAWPNDPKFAVVRAAIHDQISTSDRGPDGSTIGNGALDELRRTDFRVCPDVVAMLARMLRRRDSADTARTLLAETPPEVSRLPEVVAETAEVDLLQRETTHRAFQQLTRLHDRIPWSPRFVRQYAIALASYDRLEAAIEVVDKAIDRAEADGDPSPVELLSLLGELLLRANRYDEALHTAIRATRHRSRNVINAKLLEIDAKVALGILDEAYRLALDLRTRRPASRRAQLALARTLEYIGRGAEAANSLGMLDEPLARDRTFVLLGSWMRRVVGDYQQAKRITEAASRLMPDSAGVQSAYGWALFENDEVDAAQRVFATLDVDGKLPQDRALGRTGVAWCQLSQATYRQLHDKSFRADLIAAVEGACELDYRVSETDIIAAMVHRLFANAAENPMARRSSLLRALHYAQRALDINDVAACHRLVGRILYELRDVSGAREHFEASIRLHPYQGDYAGLGLVKLGLGDHSTATDVLQEGVARLTDARAAIPVSPAHIDLYATLGAVYLDRDLRGSTCGEDTRLAMQYLRQAVTAEPHHLFAVHNYAIALSHRGAHVDAERLIARTLANTDPTGGPGSRPWSRIGTVLGRRQPSLEVAAFADREDICSLQIRLADMLRSRENMAGGLIAKIRRRRLIHKARAYRPEADLSPRANETPRRTGRDRRLALVGVGITTTSIATAIAIWINWMVNPHQGRPLSLLDVLGLSGALAVVAVTGLRLPTVSNIKLGAFEIKYDNKGATAVGVLDLPTRAAHPLGFGRPDTVGVQWTSRWSSETRLPRLGPHTATLINGYYSSRDQALPWRRR